jgi:hypothetical protein
MFRHRAQKVSSEKNKPYFGFQWSKYLLLTCNIIPLISFVICPQARTTGSALSGTTTNLLTFCNASALEPASCQEVITHEDRASRAAV